VQIFVDSADPGAIRRWVEYGVADGVTTNPSIMLKCGVSDLEAGARRIAGMIGDRPLSVEVTTNDHELMLMQGRNFATWAPNVVVKIPIINEDGVPSLGVINTLEREGVRVNATACLSFGQAMLAAKAGATYVSLFAGRIGDEGGDPSEVIRQTRAWLDDWRLPSQIIVGSIRSVHDVTSAAAAGAHIVTVPPEFLTKMIDHRYSRETVRQFVADAHQAVAGMIANSAR
jgi:transaldolase